MEADGLSGMPGRSGAGIHMIGGFSLSVSYLSPFTLHPSPSSRKAITPQSRQGPPRPLDPGQRAIRPSGLPSPAPVGGEVLAGNPKAVGRTMGWEAWERWGLPGQRAFAPLESHCPPLWAGMGLGRLNNNLRQTSRGGLEGPRPSMFNPSRRRVRRRGELFSALDRPKKGFGSAPTRKFVRISGSANLVAPRTNPP